MRRFPALALVVAVVAVLAALVAGGLGPDAAGATPRAAHVAAQAPTTEPPEGIGDPATDPDGDIATDDAPLQGGHIIPQPNSGREPTDAGDRGGALQVALFFVIVAGVAGLGGLAYRDVRKAQRRRAAEASSQASGA